MTSDIKGSEGSFFFGGGEGFFFFSKLVFPERMSATIENLWLTLCLRGDGIVNGSCMFSLAFSNLEADYGLSIAERMRSIVLD